VLYVLYVARGAHPYFLHTYLTCGVRVMMCMCMCMCIYVYVYVCVPNVWCEGHDGGSAVVDLRGVCVYVYMCICHRYKI
jgi:hypothetical protein